MNSFSKQKKKEMLAVLLDKKPIQKQKLVLTEGRKTYIVKSAKGQGRSCLKTEEYIYNNSIMEGTVL